MYRLFNFVKYGVLGAIGALASGCAMEAPEELNVEETQQAVTINKSYIYAFATDPNDLTGMWRMSVYQNGTVSPPPTPTTFRFGLGSDVPLLASLDLVTTSIATYGKVAERLGVFYIDRNQDRVWNSGDTARKFLASPQSGDKPFIKYDQLWGRNSSGTCVPLYVGSPIQDEVRGYVVGVKRGATVYLDRDGDGYWQSGNHCDIQGTFGLSGDDPVIVPNGSGQPKFGVTRTQGTDVVWYVDENSNLSWTAGVDSAWIFGLSTDTVPASHPGGFAVKRGRDVAFDLDGSRTWTSYDKYYANVLPATGGWRLVGVNATAEAIVE